MNSLILLCQQILVCTHVLYLHPTGTEATPTSGSSQVTLPMNLLASNLKSTQSLLSALQKNLSPNSNLSPSIKSLARVLASPLVRGAQQKTTTQGEKIRKVVMGKGPSKYTLCLLCNVFVYCLFSVMTLFTVCNDLFTVVILGNDLFTSDIVICLL